MKTESPDQTMRLGRVFGEFLPPGAVVAIMGDLGTGKTVLVKGIAQGLGVADERDVTSPSFTLVNEYRGRVPVNHVDLYRLLDSVEVEDLGWEEFISGPGVALVEWAEKALALLPEERVEIHLEWLSERERKIVFAGRGKTVEELVLRLGERWSKEE